VVSLEYYTARNIVLHSTVLTVAGNDRLDMSYNSNGEYVILVGKPVVKRSLGSSRRPNGNIKMIQDI
jgi:hypothetical protein